MQKRYKNFIALEESEKKKLEQHCDKLFRSLNKKPLIVVDFIPLKSEHSARAEMSYLIPQTDNGHIAKMEMEIVLLYQSKNIL